jgi:hypothetical protein
MQLDPHFRDYVLFYEYFHGDSGRGVGASHQTGWTGLVAKLLLPRYTHTVVEPLESARGAREAQAAVRPVQAPNRTPMRASSSPSTF